MAKEDLDRLSLTPKEEELLQMAANSETFRIRDYEKFEYTSAQGFQQVVTRLTQRKLLSKVRKSAKEVRYSATGDVNLVYNKSLPQ